MTSAFLLAILASSGSVEAAQDQQVTVTAPEARKICRRVEVSSATRIARRRLCLTTQQWRQRNGDTVEEGADTLDVLSPGLSMDVPNSQGAGTRGRSAGGMGPR